eukprot:2102094-Pyramimonas_sp.AAC.1
MEGGSLSKCGSRVSAAHVRVERSQLFEGGRAGRSQYVFLAVAPRTSVLQVCSSFRDGGPFLLNTWLSP